MNFAKKIKFFSMCILLIILSFYLNGKNDEVLKKLPKGSIRIMVMDKEVQVQIYGVLVELEGRKKRTKLNGVTDKKGIFKLMNIPVGGYLLKVSCPGYEVLVKTDIIVKSNRMTQVLAEMVIDNKLTETMTITAEYFHTESKQQANSVLSLSYEEVRRAPGSAGDVSRIIYGLPSIAKVSDSVNGLIVRGGSPVENAFFIDNIEIPNINHFPVKGSSSGPIGLLNVDFINDVTFLSGGFSSIYGDRLSSVMDIRFREGNREEFDLQLDLSMIGFGLVAEGPILAKKGAWLFSARKSYLDLVTDLIGTGGALPGYSDFNCKIDFDLSEKSKITLLGIMGIDSIGFEKEDHMAERMAAYGKNDFLEYTVGLNWFYKWGTNGYSNTSISQSYNKYNADFINIYNDDLWIQDCSTEQFIALRNVNFLKLGNSHKIQFGFDYKHIMNDYDYTIGDRINTAGKHLPGLTQVIKDSADKYGLFINYKWNPSNRVLINAGARVDYFSYNENVHLSPRASLSYQVSKKTWINTSFGIYHQNLPLMLLFQQETYKDLKDIMAHHYILGVEHLVTKNIKATIELYQKDYSCFPLDPSEPTVFLLDEFSLRRGIWTHDTLVDTGKARSYGVEFILQKKLANDFYGLISASYSITEYRGLDGIWRNRVFDNRFLFSIEGGYKPNDLWEFSLRWIYAGGTPYTPFDEEQSELLFSGIYDINRINTMRNEDYHSLNIRIDRRFNFTRSNLIVYLSILNAYKRDNVDFHFWNKLENKADVSYQFGLIPSIGLEFEF